MRSRKGSIDWVQFLSFRKNGKRSSVCIFNGSKKMQKGYNEFIISHANKNTSF
jgi:hypothetical protein